MTVKLQCIAGWCHLSNTSEAFPRPSNFYNICCSTDLNFGQIWTKINRHRVMCELLPMYYDDSCNRKLNTKHIYKQIQTTVNQLLPLRANRQLVDKCLLAKICNISQPSTHNISPVGTTNHLLVLTIAIDVATSGRGGQSPPQCCDFW